MRSTPSPLRFPRHTNSLQLSRSECVMSSADTKVQLNDLGSGLGIRSYRSFPLSDLSELLMVAHFWWATWAIRSRSLICLERFERITHSCSFYLSEMSKWANERWANERIPSPVSKWRHVQILALFCKNMLAIRVTSKHACYLLCFQVFTFHLPMTIKHFGLRHDNDWYYHCRQGMRSVGDFTERKITPVQCASVLRTW